MIAVAVPPPLRALFFPPDVWESLALIGQLAVPADDADLGDPAVYAKLLAGAEIAVTSWSCPPLTAAVLDAAPALRLVAHTGASLRPYATAEAFDRGVRFTQAGLPMAYAVAEQALTLTLSLLHQVYRFDHGMRRGDDWDAVKASARPRRELLDCPVGVVGASRTGRAYIGLVRALGATVSVADPYLSDVEAAGLGVRIASLDELLRTSRVVALHAPVLPETRRMIGARELALMPDGAYLVNTARAALVDGDALLAELRAGRIDAAIDVYDEEPLLADHPLRALPNALLTPHEAGGTVDARRRGGDLIVAEIRRFLSGAPLEHEITPELMARMG